jgi:signal transduction histidine kinase
VTAEPAPTPAWRPPDADSLLAALLSTVSHDLRSPLLAVSLSMQFLDDHAAGDEASRATALDAVREGLDELERMLDAIGGVSVARRRPLDVAPAALSEIARFEGKGSDARVLADARVVREVFEAAGADAASAAIEVSRGSVAISATTELPDGVPLALLFDSLRTRAGTAVARLAALQVAVERMGGALTVAEGRLRLRLPRAPR